MDERREHGEVFVLVLDRPRDHVVVGVALQVHHIEEGRFAGGADHLVERVDVLRLDVAAAVAIGDDVADLVIKKRVVDGEDRGVVEDALEVAEAGGRGGDEREAVAVGVLRGVVVVDVAVLLAIEDEDALAELVVAVLLRHRLRGSVGEFGGREDLLDRVSGGLGRDAVAV